MEKVLDYIEGFWGVDKYIEDGKFCGYEINSYTNGGVNIIIFLDYRDTDYDVNNPNDFLTLFKKNIKEFDIDDNIETHRQYDRYRQDFTIKESLKDFERYLKQLKRIKQDLKVLIKGKSKNGLRKNMGSLEKKLDVCKTLGIDVPYMMLNQDNFASTMFDSVLRTSGDTNEEFNIITNRDFKKGSNLFTLHNAKLLYNGGENYAKFDSVKGYLYDIYDELTKDYVYFGQ